MRVTTNYELERARMSTVGDVELRRLALRSRSYKRAKRYSLSREARTVKKAANKDCKSEDPEDNRPPRKRIGNDIGTSQNSCEARYSPR